MVPDFTADGHAGGEEPQVRDLQTYFRIFENPDLARVYYQARDEPTTVPEIIDQLGMSKSSAYKYIDELVNAGLLFELGESTGASQYIATDWTITIRINGESLEMGPLMALVIANRTRYPQIERVIEEYGVEALQKCILEAQAYDRGETTTRQLAADTGVSYGLALDVLTAIANIFEFDSDEEPLTTADAPEEPITGSEVDLSELDRHGEPTEGDETGDPAIGLMERKRQSDEE